MATPSLTFPRSVFAKLSPHPYLLRTLTTSPSDATTPTRTNGRAPSEPRLLKIHTSSLSHAHGSALVRVGDTTVICGVRAEILPVTSIPQYRPVADYEALAEDEEERERRDRAELRDYDLLVPNIELATGCAPQFLPGVPPSTIAQTVSTRVYSLLHGSGMVGVEGLRVWDTSRVTARGGDGGMMDEGEEEEKPRVVAYWTLYIDLLFVSYDGNPFDAAWTAVVAALRDTKLPEVRWDPDREAVVCGSRTEGAKALGVRGLPVACSAVVFLEKERGEPGEGRHWLLMDPDRLEEGLCGEAITVVVDCEGGETRVRAMEKVGGVVVGRELVRGFVGVAEKRWKEVKAAMK